MPTNKNVIYVIVSTVALAAFLCTFTICLLAYFGIKIPPELNTLAGGALGAITGMLVKTSPTETTKNVIVQDQPTIVDQPEPPKP